MLDAPTSRMIYAATIALVVGVVVYLIDRQADAYFLPAGFASLMTLPPLLGSLAKNLPSFLHVYAFILLTVACLPPTRMLALATCIAWFTVEALFEIGQHPLLNNQVAALMPEWFDGVPFLEASADYFIRGSFDPLDIAAAALGAVAAWLTIWNIRRRRHENA